MDAQETTIRRRAHRRRPGTRQLHGRWAQAGLEVLGRKRIGPLWDRNPVRSFAAVRYHQCLKQVMSRRAPNGFPFSNFDFQKSQRTRLQNSHESPSVVVSRLRVEYTASLREVPRAQGRPNSRAHTALAAPWPPLVPKRVEGVGGDAGTAPGPGMTRSKNLVVCGEGGSAVRERFFRRAGQKQEARHIGTCAIDGWARALAGDECARYTLRLTKTGAADSENPKTASLRALRHWSVRHRPMCFQQDLETRDS
jgi:hypothetical protein